MAGPTWSSSTRPSSDVLKPDVNAVQTLLAERTAGGWRIVLLQNTPAQHHGRPDLVEQHTAELGRAEARRQRGADVAGRANSRRLADRAVAEHSRPAPWPARPGRAAHGRARTC